MSIKVVSWALNRAPVVDPMLVLTLVAMAEVAHDDGTESRQSMATVASKMRVSERTAQRYTRILEDRGIIVRGDQSATGHLRADRRPVVYDLQIDLNRGANLSPRESTSEGLRGDRPGSHGVTAVSDKPSLLPSEEFVLKASTVHRRSASVDENTRTRRKFQSKSADYDTPVRPVDDENEQLEAPVKGASPGKRAGAAVAKKAMDRGESGYGLAMRLKHGLLDKGVRGETNVAALAARIKAQHESGRSWDHLAAMVDLFCSARDRYTGQSTAQPWKQFLNESESLAVDSQKIMKAKSWHKTDEEIEEMKRKAAERDVIESERRAARRRDRAGV